LRTIDRQRELVEGRYGKALIAYVRLKRKPAAFEQMVRGLVERGFPIVGVEYASPTYNYPNLRLLRDVAKRTERSLFHVSRIPSRRLGLTEPLSPFHFLELFGVDSMSLGVRAVGGGKQQVANVTRFTPKGLGVLSLMEYEANNEVQPDCTCPVCKGKSVLEFYDSFRRRPEGQKDDSTYFRSVTKVHEAFSSLTELRLSQDFIQNGDFMREYVPTKRYLKDQISRGPLR